MIGRFRLATWILILTTALTTAAGFGASFFAFQPVNALIVEEVAKGLGEQSRRLGDLLIDDIDHLRSDVVFLAKTPPIKGIIRARKHDGIDPLDGSNEELWRRRLATIFTSMLEAKPEYLQIRYIGSADRGREIVRVDRSPDHSRSIRTVGDEELQQKWKEPYFVSSLRVPTGEIFVSDVDLNRDHGEITIPPLPVLRAAVPVFESSDSEEAFGILIINMDFRRVLADVRSVSSVYAGMARMYMTNDQGDYLVHPEAEKEFAFERGPPRRIQEDFSAVAAVLHRTETKPFRSSESSSADFVSLVKVRFDRFHPERFLAICLMAPPTIIQNATEQAKSRVVSVTTGIVAFGVGIGWIFAWRISRSIGALVVAADQISRGGKGITIKDQGTYEIRKLAESLSEMSSTIAEREHALAAVSAQSVAVLDCTADAILTIDSRGTILSINPATMRLFGYPEDAFLGRNVKFLCPEFHALRHDGYLDNYLRTGDAQIIGKPRQLKGLHRDGHEFPFLLTVTETAIDSQTVFVGSCRDISAEVDARHKLELTNQQLRKAEAQALAGTEAKSQFLAMMSHEIRTPMNGVIGMTDLLIDTELTPEQQGYCQAVRGSSDALLIIINDILDYSKIEAGKLELESNDFSLLTTVDDVLDLIATGGLRDGVSLLSLVEYDVPVALRGDPGRLRQILMNLLGNASKFTSEGEIFLHVELLESDERGVRLRFSVSDTGIGIDPDRIGRLFDSFAQADASTTRRFGGTGLGLSIAQRLVELMGGEIAVDSALNRGTTFSVTPRFECGPIEVQAESSPSENLAGLKALSISKRGPGQRVLLHYLEAWGIRVNTQEELDLAIPVLENAAVNGEAFDLLIVHGSIGDERLTEFARRVRSDARSEDLRLVLITPVRELRDAELARTLGFDLCVGQPIRRSEFFALLANTLGRPVRKNAGAMDREHATPVRDVLLPQSGVGASLLVVEDNAVNQKMITLLLRKLGYRVTLAENGHEALEAVSKDSYDLVLMDCQMPEMDGFEATRAIRETERESGEHLPIIALTANASERDRQVCLDAGMDEFLTKPIRRDALERALNLYLSIG